MLKLIYLIRYCLFLFFLGLFVLGCSQTDFFVLDQDLLSDVETISSCITGIRNKVDGQSNLIYQETCNKNFPEAHKLLPLLKNSLEKYAEEIRSPIYIGTLKNLRTKLKALEGDIDRLPDGRDKAQFNEEYKKLVEYVHSLINKDSLGRPGVHHYPGS